MKRVTLIVFLLALLASFTLLTWAQEPLSAGTVEGTLESGTATYQLNADEGDVFFLLLSSPDFDTYVEVLTNQGDSIATDDDSGMGSNSALLFVAPASGTFEVVVRAYSGEASGAYTLTLVDEVTDVTAGSTVDLDVDGTTSSIFRFEAAGDPVDIMVDSDGKVDTSLTVIDAEGNLIDKSDDAINMDPALLPILLDAGVYYLLISPYSEAAVGPATLSIVAAESRALGAEPTIFNFGVGTNEDLATVDVEEGKLYRFEVAVSELGDFNLNLSAIDPEQYTYGYFSFTNGLGGTYLYRADLTGQLQVQLSAGYMVTDDELIEYTVTFTEVAED